MIAGLVVIIMSQLAAFIYLMRLQASQFDTILNSALNHIKAKDLGEVVQTEQLRKSYDVQLAHMKDNLAKEADQLERQRMVKDELSGQLVDLNQYEIL